VANLVCFWYKRIRDISDHKFSTKYALNSEQCACSPVPSVLCSAALRHGQRLFAQRLAHSLFMPKPCPLCLMLQVHAVDDHSSSERHCLFQSTVVSQTMQRAV
jgi:hypothetical protein